MSQEYQPMSTHPQEVTSTDIQHHQVQNFQEKQNKIIKLNIDPNRSKYGRMIVIVDNKWCLITLGPDYICFLIAFTIFCIIAYILCVTVSNSLKNQFIIWLTYVISISQCLSYFLVAISNPGISLPQQNPITQITQQNRYRVCGRCGAQSRRKTYHCRECDVCVKGYDHHCPWTSKCIGQGNLYRFYFFVTITPIYILFFIGLMMGVLVINAQQAVKKNHLKTHPV